MEGINNKRDVKIEVLTPLSIGAGAEKDWVKGADFVIEENKLYKINLKKMAMLGIDINQMTSYFASKNESGIKRLIGSRLTEVSDFVMDFPVETDNDIKVFVKNQLTNNPLLVGSSLKGAIRSIIFEHLGGKSKDGKEVFGSSVDGDDFMRFVKISDADFDETKLVNTKIFNLKKSGDWVGGWKKDQNSTEIKFNPIGFNTLYECIMPKQIGFCSMMLAEKTFSNFKFLEFYQDKAFKLQNKAAKKGFDISKDLQTINKLKGNINDKKKILDLNVLFKIINEHTQNYLNKERDFFKEYKTDKTDEIIKSIDYVLSQIPDDNSSCVLKMSAGSGFHSITGDWQFDDYINGELDRKNREKDSEKKRSFNKLLSTPGKLLPKSRKIAIDGDNFSLMGFVKLTIVSEEEKNRKLEQIKQEKVRLENERLEKIRLEREAAELAEKERLEKERQQEEEWQKAEAKLKAKMEKYDSLIEEAFSLKSGSKIEDALSKLKEAKECYPEGTKHNELMNELEIMLNKSKRLASGLSFLLETKVDSTELKLSELSNGVKRITDFLKKNKEYQISDSDEDSVGKWLRLLPKPTKKADVKEYSDFNSKSWKMLSDLFGEAKAKEWFDELTK